MDTVRTVCILAAAIFLAFIAWQIFHFVLWLLTMLITVTIVVAVLYLAVRILPFGHRHRTTW